MHSTILILSTNPNITTPLQHGVVERVSVVVKALCCRLKVVGSRPDELNLSIYLILLVNLDSGLYSASNRNEYQKHKNNVSGEYSPNRSPWPVTGIV
jgi:hypothetical protein